jgi:hypothetical protein
MAYVVTTGAVSAETQVTEAGGRAVLDFPRGAVLPDDVPTEQLEAFLARGQIAEVGHASPEPEIDLSELDKDQLFALAKKRGLQVDGRWGADKLLAALQEHQE